MGFCLNGNKNKSVSSIIMIVMGRCSLYFCADILNLMY